MAKPNKPQPTTPTQPPAAKTIEGVIAQGGTPPPSAQRAQEPALTTQATSEVQAHASAVAADDAQQMGINSVTRGEPGTYRALDGSFQTPATEEKRGPSEAEANEALLEELLSRLSRHAGEDWRNEGAVDVLERIIREHDGMRHLFASEGQEDVEPVSFVRDLLRERLVLQKRVADLEAQLQPAHNAFRLSGLGRGILVSHVKGTAKDYDTGGRYRVATVTVKDGEVVLAEMVEVANGGTTSELTFGQANDRVQKLVEDFLTPGAHRS